REPGCEERACTLDLEGEELAEGLVGAPGDDRCTAPGEAGEVLLGNVDPTAPGVLRHVLPEVRQLERRADVVGALLTLGVPVAEEGGADPPQGVRGVPTVAEHVGEGGEGPRLPRRVTAERFEEVGKRPDRQGMPGDRVPEGEEDRIIDRLRILRAGEEPLLPEPQATAPVGALLALVGDAAR